MGWTGELLCLLGARFPDAALEHRYREFRTRNYFLRDDGFQAGLRAFAIGALGMRGLVKSGPTPGTAVIFLMFVAPVLQLAMRSLADRRGRTEAALAAYMGQRCAWAALSRTLLCPLVVCTYFLEFFQQPPGPSATWFRLSSYVLYSTGAMVLFLSCVGYPVLLEHHLAIQALSVLMVAYWRAGPFCREALAADGGPEHVLAAWRALEAASRWVLAAMYMREVPAAPEPDPMPACGHVVLAMYGCVGLAATTYVLWLVEHKSRVHFLKETGWGNWMGWEPLGERAVVFQIVMGAACLAVAWQVLRALLLGRPPEGGGGWEGGGDVAWIVR
ncbi:unnamed protein product [Ostreobium quekettii]|uniref:Uncharacterized protein n=1 Tax=Ostreobium quekettii TaxID=121088 RepID=A0A8S1J049_9CHLO|nr:unnamed protein product [Ostreobium quekettii]|eukprot:evm.model.scf_160EXC.2 EVM.evm.TU.scf_160EXC.2   scf_160EXC:42333-43322(-)